MRKYEIRKDYSSANSTEIICLILRSTAVPAIKWTAIQAASNHNLQTQIHYEYKYCLVIGRNGLDLSA